jgi:hypothetical protein
MRLKSLISPKSVIGYDLNLYTGQLVTVSSLP